MKKKKKGILFTITTIFLLLAVFLLSSAYLTRNKELQRTATISLAGDRLRYIEDDITDNIYSDLVSINLESISRGTYVTVVFNHSNLSSSINHRQLMQDYETFIEGAYSALNNINIDLIGFNNSFSLSPYNSTFTIDSNMIYVYTENPDNIDRIQLIMDIDEATLNTSDGQPSDTGDIEVEIEMTHSGGEFNPSADLDPTVNNDPFYVNFEAGSRIEINFGLYNSQSGVLRVNASGLKADISHLEFRYNLLSEKVIIKGGNISIIYPVENITKKTEIIIAEE
ncbi:hypothetical protein KY361_04375 [Candidatus Woesearchaeota archaeon]|nr:hypothetical protein [Candidatus Woesearchaeota archaeon]